MLLDVGVVGTSSRWDTSSEADGPTQIGRNASFSMIKVPVDRRKLTPSIRNLCHFARTSFATADYFV